ncbi:MAG TPA: methyltransferase domain-containing protein [Pyrinomonadaceae bacterium]|nr:methyltransferase domain-containing protein [Pyrinomonadaceae bacterium]
MANSFHRWFEVIKHAFARGTFPHEMSFILELGWRNLLLSPPDLVKRLPLTKNSRVLEVGAGSGFYSVAVAEVVREGKLELLDLQEEMLAKARQKMECAGLKNIGYTLAKGDGRIPFDDGSFDVVFMVTVLGEVKDQESLIRETNRLLQRGGTLSVSEHLPDPDFVTSGKLLRLLENNGLRFDWRFGRSWAYTANYEKI